MRLDIWCTEQLRYSFPRSHPQFLIKSRDTGLIDRIEHAARLAIFSDPFEPFQHHLFTFIFDGITNAKHEKLLENAYHLIRDWHYRRRGFAHLFVSDLFAIRGGSSGLVVAVSKHGDVVPISLNAVAIQRNIQIAIDGVVGFDYSEAAPFCRTASHPRVRDLGALYIEKDTTISNANLINPKGHGAYYRIDIPTVATPKLDINNVPDFDQISDISERRKVMEEWLTKVMLSSPHTKILVRDRLADQYGEVLGILSDDPKRAFQSIWKRAISKLEARHTDHVWSKAGRPRA